MKVFIRLTSNPQMCPEAWWGLTCSKEDLGCVAPRAHPRSSEGSAARVARDVSCLSPSLIRAPLLVVQAAVSDFIEALLVWKPLAAYGHRYRGRPISRATPHKLDPRTVHSMRYCASRVGSCGLRVTWKQSSRVGSPFFSYNLCSWQGLSGFATQN